MFAAKPQAAGATGMFLPETYQAALFLMLLSMLCWGSWANTLKLCPGYRFQLFYWDYAIGLLLAAVVWGLTAGSLGHAGPPFLDALWPNARSSTILFAMCGGVVFNVANLLLVAAIDVAGLAVAFPVGIGLALVIGAVSSYVISPRGQSPSALRRSRPGRRRHRSRCRRLSQAREHRESRQPPAASSLSLVAGVLMGGLYPFATHDLGSVPAGPGPYAIAFFFAIGVLLSTVPANLLLMAKPLDGKPPVDGSRLLARPVRLAPCRRPWRSHLVRRRRRQLRRLGRAPRNPSDRPSPTPSARVPPWSQPAGESLSGTNSPAHRAPPACFWF